MRRSFDLLTSTVGSKLRFNTGQHILTRSSTIPKTNLTLYEYEASPWCRLVREHLNLLGLPVLIKPTPRQTLLTEGAFDKQSKYRHEAWTLIQQNQQFKENRGIFQFPLLLDNTETNENKLIYESSSIISHLWTHYSENVIENRPSNDSLLNSNGLPFFLRFPLLSAPSVLRPFPHCGLFQLPSTFNQNKTHRPLVLKALEGCPQARLIREKLSSMCIVYYNVPCGKVGAFQLIDSNKTNITSTSIMNSKTEKEDEETKYEKAGVLCTTLDSVFKHLDTEYSSTSSSSSLTSTLKLYGNKMNEEDNLGRSGWFGDAARNAMTKGTDYFVHPDIGQIDK